MRPLLEVLSDGAVWPKHPLEDEIARRAGMTEEQRAEVLPLKSSIAHHREKAETLRVALQARAFRGEL
jgi:hypothetical protein